MFKSIFLSAYKQQLQHPYVQASLGVNILGMQELTVLFTSNSKTFWATLPLVDVLDLTFGTDTDI